MVQKLKFVPTYPSLPYNLWQVISDFDIIISTKSLNPSTERQAFTIILLPLIDFHMIRKAVIAANTPDLIASELDQRHLDNKAF